MVSARPLLNDKLYLAKAALDATYPGGYEHVWACHPEHPVVLMRHPEGFLRMECSHDWGMIQQGKTRGVPRDCKHKNEVARLKMYPHRHELHAKWQGLGVQAILLDLMAMIGRGRYLGQTNGDCLKLSEAAYLISSKERVYPPQRLAIAARELAGRNLLSFTADVLRPLS